MNKKMILVALIALGFSSLTYSSDGGTPPTPTKISKIIVDFIKAAPTWSIWLPATLLKNIAYFKNMGPWTGRAFSVVVWAAIACAIKVASDKYQERKKRSMKNEELEAVLRALDQAQSEAEQAEIVDIEGAEETIS